MEKSYPSKNSPAKFEQAYCTLRARIEAFLILPTDRLWKNREQFKVELDIIAKLP